MGSLVVNASGDHILRTANLPSIHNFTAAGWVKLDAVTSSTTLIHLRGDVGDARLYVSGSSAFAVQRNAGAEAAFDATPSSGTWVYVALSQSSGAINGWWWTNNAGSLVLGGSVNSTDTYASAGTSAVMGISGYAYTDPAMSNNALGKYAYWKTWDVALTEQQIKDDAYSPTYVYTTSKNTGFADSSTDISGNGRDWTHSSITTDSDTPPVNLDTPIKLRWTLS